MKGILALKIMVLYTLERTRDNLGGNQLRTRVDRAIRGGGVCAGLREQASTPDAEEGGKGKAKYEK